MKKLVLALILVFSASAGSFSQKDLSREILKSSLRKMSGGKAMTAFELQKTFEKLGKTPANMVQSNAMLDLLEELVKTAPDSVKKQLELQFREANNRMSQSMLEIYQGQIERILADLKSNRVATIRLNKNALKASMDTVRNIYDPAGSQLADLLTYNPVALLQLMTADTTELHYTGTTLLNDEENHIMQAKKGIGWLDIHVEKKSGLVTRIAQSRIDNDPLIGSQPEHYQHYIHYQDYQKINGYLLPKSVEEISTTMDFTIRSHLEWTSINKAFPESTFAPEPSYVQKIQYKSVALSDSLFVIRQLGESIENRSLVKITPNGQVDCFMEPINHNELADKFFKTLKEQFPRHSVRNVFCSDNVSSVSTFNPLFNQNVKVLAPKGHGVMAEEKQYIYNQAEEPVYKAKKAEGALIIFQDSFEKDGVQIFVINPDPKEEWDQRNVFYYLPQEKLVYYHSINYFGADKSANASPKEEWLYDFLINKKLPIDYLIITDSFVDNAPLRMSFAEFEKKVKGTK